MKIFDPWILWKITKVLFLEHQRICSFWGLPCCMLENPPAKWSHLDPHPSSKYDHQFKSEEMDAWEGQLFLWFFWQFVQYKYNTTHIKHNCSFPLSDVQKYFNDFASFTNLKSVLGPGRNDLLRGLTSLSLSRMERIPHQVINLNFTLFIRLYDYYNVPSHICNMKQSEMNDTHRCYNFFKLIYCQDTILIDIIKMKNPLEFVFIWPLE